MSRAVRVDCPICGNNTIEIRFATEYQGEHPHGGMVESIDEAEAMCGCELTDEEYEDCLNKADGGTEVERDYDPHSEGERWLP